MVISQFTFDAADPVGLARWWASALGWRLAWEPEGADDEEVEIEPGDGSATHWLFVPVSEGKTVKNRVHPDLRPPDGSSQQAELERLLALGARPVDVGQGDVTWHVLADPEGNEFCLLRSTPSQLAEYLAAQQGG
jgi:hypothetical protein